MPSRAHSPDFVGAFGSVTSPPVLAPAPLACLDAFVPGADVYGPRTRQVIAWLRTLVEAGPVDADPPFLAAALAACTPMQPARARKALAERAALFELAVEHARSEWPHARGDAARRAVRAGAALAVLGDLLTRPERVQLTAACAIYLPDLPAPGRDLDGRPEDAFSGRVEPVGVTEAHDADLEARYGTNAAELRALMALATKLPAKTKTGHPPNDTLDFVRDRLGKDTPRWRENQAAQLDIMRAWKGKDVPTRMRLMYASAAVGLSDLLRDDEFDRLAELGREALGPVLLLERS